MLPFFLFLALSFSSRRCDISHFPCLVKSLTTQPLPLYDIGSLRFLFSLYECVYVLDTLSEPEVSSSTQHKHHQQPEQHQREQSARFQHQKQEWARKQREWQQKRQLWERQQWQRRRAASHTNKGLYSSSSRFPVPSPNPPPPPLSSFASIYPFNYDCYPPRGNVALVSSLGVDALQRLADALVLNNKYRYGVLAYEAAITVHKLLKRRDHESLTRRLCSICTENRDWARAVKYHLRILNKAMRRRNLNEFIYVSEVCGIVFCPSFQRALAC